jgi:hypothetical protein
MSCEIIILSEETEMFCWLCGGSNARKTQLALFDDDKIGLCASCNAGVLEHAENTRAMGFGDLTLVGGPIGTEVRAPLATCGGGLSDGPAHEHQGVSGIEPRAREAKAVAAVRADPDDGRGLGTDKAG